MSRNRFDDITSILHFNDNDDIPQKKIQALIDHFLKVYFNFILHERHVSRRRNYIIQGFTWTKDCKEDKEIDL